MALLVFAVWNRLANLTCVHRKSTGRVKPCQAQSVDPIGILKAREGKQSTHPYDTRQQSSRHPCSHRAPEFVIQSFQEISVQQEACSWRLTLITLDSVQDLPINLCWLPLALFWQLAYLACFGPLAWVRQAIIALIIAHVSFPCQFQSNWSTSAWQDSVERTCIRRSDLLRRGHITSHWWRILLLDKNIW